MNIEIKEKWQAALESGEYKQCRGKLRKGDGYCCLGVLTDIYRKEKGGEWEKIQYMESDVYTFDSSQVFLHPMIREWAGVNDILLRDLTHLNDSGATFQAISKVIGKRL